jgi:5-methylcytosine-specific restriction endonuclease McrA
MTRQPEASDEFIWWLFRNRCLVCGHLASEINEIIPRSRGPESLSDWKNRVTMCREDHNEYHRHGVSEDAIKKLQEQRIEFLIAIGRGEYVD